MEAAYVSRRSTVLHIDMFISNVEISITEWLILQWTMSHPTEKAIHGSRGAIQRALQVCCQPYELPILQMSVAKTSCRRVTSFWRVTQGWITLLDEIWYAAVMLQYIR